MLGYFGLHKLNWPIAWIILSYLLLLSPIDIMVHIGTVALHLLYADVNVIYLFSTVYYCMLSTMFIIHMVSKR